MVRTADSAADLLKVFPQNSPPAIPHISLKPRCWSRPGVQFRRSLLGKEAGVETGDLARNLRPRELVSQGSRALCPRSTVRIVAERNLQPIGDCLHGWLDHPAGPTLPHELRNVDTVAYQG